MQLEFPSTQHPMFLLGENQRHVQLARGLLYGGVGILVGPLVIGLALVIRRWRLEWRWMLLLCCLSLLWTAWLIDTGTKAISFVELLTVVWIGGILSAPLIAIVLSGLDWGIVFLKPRSLDEQLREMQQQLQRGTDRESSQARRDAQRQKHSQSGLITLGPVLEVKGGYLPEWVGMQVDRQQWLTLEDRILNEHMLVIGATGAGKTVLLTRLVTEILAASERDVYLIDGKGELAWAEEIANHVYQAKGVPVPVFSLGHEQFIGAIYNGFAGSKQAIFERLFAMISHEGGSADAEHYREMDREILQVLCGIGNDAVTPPDSFEELRDRLNKRWMRDAYRGDPYELEAIEEIDEKQLRTLATRMRTLLRDFGHIIGPEGFSLDEVTAAIFSMKVGSAGDASKRLLKFLIEDVKDFSGNVVRQKKRPGVLIIDEFGVFGNHNVILLLQQARSAGLSVILATQDVATLGDELQREAILNNCRTKVLMVTDFPQKVAELAGTITRLESSLQHVEGGATGLGSAREQDTFMVHPNEVRKLQAGQAFVIRQARAVKLQIKKANEVEHDPKAIAHFERKQATTTEPLPEKKNLL